MAEKETDDVKYRSSKGSKPVNENAAFKKGEDLKAIAYDKGQDKKKHDVVDVEISIFFDGTGNNMSNTNSTIKGLKQAANDTQEVKDLKDKLRAKALMDRAKIEGDKLLGNASYGNEYTNVARLFELFKPKELKGAKLYVEGQGTNSGDGDSVLGMGVGDGTSGIVGRVEKACKDAVDEKINPIVDKLAKKNPKIVNPKTNNRVIDAFGFSRGAAAARHFVHEINKPEGKDNPKFGKLGAALEAKKIEVRHLVVRFLGIYDTVSSYEPVKAKLGTGVLGGAAIGGLAGAAIGGVAAAGSIIKNKFKDDVEQLKLDDIGMCKKVVHFTAGDEFRANFSLTTARSHNGGKAKELQFVEKMLPGAHSDIGGSYVDGDQEKATFGRKIDKADRDVKPDKTLEQSYFVKNGWFTEEQIQYTDDIGKFDIMRIYDGTRTITNKYSFIPLHFMYELALESELLFENVKGKYPIINSLTNVEAKLREVVFEGGDAYLFDKLPKTVRGYSNPDVEEYKELRNKHLHFSAVLDGGLHPNAARTKENGSIAREIFKTVPSTRPGG
jgi:hypothetical protein